ncbi:hypothetical protein J6590_091075, partial [Homalodisca vitripennis]
MVFVYKSLNRENHDSKEYVSFNSNKSTEIIKYDSKLAGDRETIANNQDLDKFQTYLRLPLQTTLITP